MIPFRSVIIIPCFRNIAEFVIQNAHVALQIRVIRELFRKFHKDFKSLYIIHFRLFIIVSCLRNIAESFVRTAQVALQLHVIWEHSCNNFSACIINYKR